MEHFQGSGSPLLALSSSHNHTPPSVINHCPNFKTAETSFSCLRALQEWIIQWWPFSLVFCPSFLVRFMHTVVQSHRLFVLFGCRLLNSMTLPSFIHSHLVLMAFGWCSLWGYYKEPQYIYLGPCLWWTHTHISVGYISWEELTGSWSFEIAHVFSKLVTPVCTSTSSGLAFSLLHCPPTPVLFFHLSHFSHSNEWVVVCHSDVLFAFFFFLPHPQHVEVPRPGTEPMPQLWPQLLQWQCRIPNLPCHRRTPCLLAFLNLHFPHDWSLSFHMFIDHLDILFCCFSSFLLGCLFLITHRHIFIHSEYESLLDIYFANTLWPAF